MESGPQRYVWREGGSEGGRGGGGGGGGECENGVWLVSPYVLVLQVSINWGVIPFFIETQMKKKEDTV